MWLPFLVRSWFIFRVGVILALQIELRRCFILNNRKIKIKFNEWLEFPFLILFGLLFLLPFCHDLNCKPKEETEDKNEEVFARESIIWQNKYLQTKVVVPEKKKNRKNLILNIKEVKMLFKLVWFSVIIVTVQEGSILEVVWGLVYDLISENPLKYYDNIVLKF